MLVVWSGSHGNGFGQMVSASDNPWCLAAVAEIRSRHLLDASKSKISISCFGGYDFLESEIEKLTVQNEIEILVFSAQPNESSWIPHLIFCPTPVSYLISFSPLYCWLILAILCPNIVDLTYNNTYGSNWAANPHLNEGRQQTPPTLRL